MIVQYCSDLHLEFPENAEYISRLNMNTGADILILAGDIVPFHQMHLHMDVLKRFSDSFKQVFWIAGNHEYYFDSIDYRTGSFKENIFDNLLLLNNQQVEINQVGFIFSTLWTKISNSYEKIIAARLSDYHVINANKKTLTVADTNRMHQQSLEYIKQALENTETQKNIVVTHHVPSLLFYPEAYKKSPLNEALVVDLSNTIEIYQPEYWIYGHSHMNTPPFQIGNTTLLTNQLGYIRKNEHLAFEFTKGFEIG